MKFNTIIIILSSLLSHSQEMKRGDLIKQEFSIEYTEVFKNGDEWFFIDTFYSDEELEKDKYEISETITIDNLFNEVSSTKKMKFKYFIYDIFVFKKNYGLKKVKTFVINDLSILNFDVDFFKYLDYDEKNNTLFNCSNYDIVYENIVYTNKLGLNTIVFEYSKEKKHIYTSIFNVKCSIYERYKFEENNFKFLYEEDYLILKSKKYLILYTF